MAGPEADRPCYAGKLSPTWIRGEPLTSKAVPRLAGTGSPADERKEDLVEDLSDSSGGGEVRRRNNWLRTRSAGNEATSARTSPRIFPLWLARLRIVVIAPGAVVGELVMDTGAQSGAGEVVAEQPVDGLDGDARGAH